MRLPVDVSIDELPVEAKIRTIALMMATRYHAQGVIKDAPMYLQLKHEGAAMQALTPQVVIETARLFERFLLGVFSRGLAEEAMEEVAAELLAAEKAAGEAAPQ